MAIEAVKTYFKKIGIEEVLEFDTSSATVELAAQAKEWVDVYKNG